MTVTTVKLKAATSLKNMPSVERVEGISQIRHSSRVAVYR